MGVGLLCLDCAAVGMAGEADPGAVRSAIRLCSSITCFLNSEFDHMKVRKLAGLGGHLREGFMNTGWRDVEGMSYLADRPSGFPKAFDVSMIYP